MKVYVVIFIVTTKNIAAVQTKVKIFFSIFVCWMSMQNVKHYKCVPDLKLAVFTVE